ncbi:choice-of-anchor A family protein [Streptomyces sp. JJ38]|uniref:choice-of-anchor A family protein n=1 Tax=Streptomyces sp. JJ38 TaxID=2738128 RepID=UPI001C575EFD|nr:choice-of-anchor A family protein [Streptomyces sp. JJ38]MBW1598988.1 choice-of-anchor A family protein [Streptomyces sp. JJ38]
MRPLPPRAALVPALLAVGGLLLATPAPAVAAPACGPQLGAAGAFTEFVEGDAARFGSTEGAVAVGGDADFTRGFRLAAHPASGDMPVDTTLVVGGTLHNGSAGSATFTVLERGTAVYGELDGRPPVLKSGLEVVQGGSAVDFAAEFRDLRDLSERLDALPARGSVTVTTANGGAVVRLMGADQALNVFPVSAEQLASARRVELAVPRGATTVVNVSGPVYADGAPRIESRPTPEGSTEGDGGDRAGAGGLAPDKLLWNFPDATKVVQPAKADWPGTLLAPHADVELGSGGQVSGTVIAASLDGPGSDTRRAPFTGCLDTPLAPPASPSASAGSTGSADEDLAGSGSDGTIHGRALLAALVGALAAGAAGLWTTAGRRDRDRGHGNGPARACEGGRLDVSADTGHG